MTRLVNGKGIKRASINMKTTAMRVSTADSGGEVEQRVEATRDWQAYAFFLEARFFLGAGFSSSSTASSGSSAASSTGSGAVSAGS